GHYHHYYLKDDRGYYFRLAIAQNVSAVTGACLMVKRESFLEAGGFDEAFEIAFGDVDLCLKLREKGLFIIYTPDAKLYHHESKTRGYEDTPDRVKRFKKEVELLRLKWPRIFKEGDPYYNPNLSLMERLFIINVPGRRKLISALAYKIVSLHPSVFRAYSHITQRYHIYVRPRLIKLVDSVLRTPKLKTTIRLIYRKIFYY
ncbi:MAG: hypothetical protein ABSG42_09615, partial [Nitrospirota bacterium]